MNQKELFFMAGRVLVFPRVRDSGILLPRNLNSVDTFWRTSSASLAPEEESAS